MSTQTTTYMPTLNIINVLYLTFRLSPLIIVSFFTLETLIKFNFKGIVYMAGLLFACLFAVMIGASVGNDGSNPDERCNVIALGDKAISNIPLSMIVFSYTFFYLLIFIFNSASTTTRGILGKNSMKRENINIALRNNIPTLIIFPLLIIIEFFWLSAYQCNNQLNIILSMFLGSIMGVLWAIMITSFNIPRLQYFNTTGGNDVCSIPKKTIYKCRTLR
jgi:hypothetical protein